MRKVVGLGRSQPRVISSSVKGDSALTMYSRTLKARRAIDSVEDFVDVVICNANPWQTKLKQVRKPSRIACGSAQEGNNRNKNQKNERYLAKSFFTKMM